MTPDSEREKRESEEKTGIQDTQAPLQKCEPGKKTDSVQKKQVPKEQK